MKLQGLGTRAQAITLAFLALALALFVARRATGGAGDGQPRPRGAAGPGAVAPALEDGAGPVAASAPGKRSRAREVSPDEVPALRPDDLAARKPSGALAAGRDLFDFRPPTPVPPPPPTPAPTPVPACGSPSFVGPCPPPPPPAATPTPTPPEIAFRFIGSFGPKDNPIAVLVQDGQVVNAQAGDVVFQRFRVVRVNYESVDIGFVPRPWTWKETRRLGITP